MDDLTREVKNEARRIGFDLVGITDPRPSEHASHYREWLKRGYNAGMGFLARPDAVAKRADVGTVMPGVRSIVVVGLNYYPGDHPPTTGTEGRVARYAWGADYHDVMMDRLQQLADRLAAQAGRPVAHRSYVDFGPILERELARRAGLGWLGKNTSLIHPSLGSYVFLGELLLDAVLEPDTGMMDGRCGNCRACLEACPTGALVAPRLLDARRCISYLTIEHRDAIPEDLRPLMGDWVFGCDVCQAVCPWNKRFARPAAASVFGASQPTLHLTHVLSLDADAFRSRFRDTPLARAQRAGLLRNAAVALGNNGARTGVAALERACLDQEPLVAEHALWALEQVRAN